MFNVNRKKSLLIYSTILGGCILLLSLSRSSVTSAQQQDAYLRHVRTIYGSDVGVSNPVGLAFSPKANSILLLDAPGAAQPGVTNSKVVAINLYEDPLGSVSVPTVISDPLNMAFNGRANRLLFIDKLKNKLIEIKAKSSGIPDNSASAITEYDAQKYNLKNPKGMAFDPISGRLFILEKDGRVIIVVTPDDQQEFDSVAAEKQGRICKIHLSPLWPVQPQSG